LYVQTYYLFRAEYRHHHIHVIMCPRYLKLGTNSSISVYSIHPFDTIFKSQQDNKPLHRDCRWSVVSYRYTKMAINDALPRKTTRRDAIVSAIYCPPFCKVWLRSVSLSPSAMPGNELECRFYVEQAQF